MRQILAALALLASLSAAPAQEGAVEGVISDQLQAFQADDYVRAFEHAAPGIRQLFATPERFGAMVRQGYPMVHRPAEVRYLGLSVRGEGVRQRVMIRDAEGAVHLLDYDLVQVNGVWRISAVRLVEGETLGV